MTFHCMSTSTGCRLYGQCLCACVNCQIARLSLLTPNPMVAQTEDSEMSFVGTTMLDTIGIVVRAHRMFRGSRLTVYSGTKNIVVAGLVIGRQEQIVQPVAARMFRPNGTIHHRGGPAFVCTNTLELPTVVTGQEVMLRVVGPPGRTILAMIHGQSHKP